MANIEEIQESVSSIKESVSQVDAKLDLVKERIDALTAGTTISQEQIDALAASLSEVKEHASKILSEADSLDGEESEPAPSEEPLNLDPEGTTEG